MTHRPSSTSATIWAEGDLRQNPHHTPDKGDRVRRMFTAIARSYDLNNRVHSFGRDQAWRRAVVNRCNVQPHEHVLDVACGTGDLAEAFAKAGPASVTGLDFTEAMLAIARDKAQRLDQQRDQRLTYVQGDAMNLPFADGSYDVLSIAFGIRNVSDPAAAFAEFHRVLRPGGRVAVLEFSQPRNGLIRFFNSLYCNRIMPVTASLLAWDRSGAYRYLPRSVETFLAADELAAALERAGFVDIAQHPMTFGVCTITMAVRP